jgi:putative transposase
MEQQRTGSSNVGQKAQGGQPRKIVTELLRSYGVGHRKLMPDAIHDTLQTANNRAEQSHETRGSRRAVADAR